MPAGAASSLEMPVACATLLLAVVPPMLSTCCTGLTRSELVQANAVLKCDADASKPITMDKLCAGAREVPLSPTLGFRLACPSDPPVPVVWLC